MKKIGLIVLSALMLTACSSLIPYKDQNLDYLYNIQKSPDAYKGAVVAFEGEVMGVRETREQIRLILKINAPLYYYATGKGGALSYELLLVEYPKTAGEKIMLLDKGETLKVLGRVDGYEKRSSPFGKNIGVVRLKAIAIADQTSGKDIHPKDGPDEALYHSWKEGKLFFDETAKDILKDEASVKQDNKK